MDINGEIIAEDTWSQLIINRLTDPARNLRAFPAYAEPTALVPVLLHLARDSGFTDYIGSHSRLVAGLAEMDARSDTTVTKRAIAYSKLAEASAGIGDVQGMVMHSLQAMQCLAEEMQYQACDEVAASTVKALSEMSTKSSPFLKDFLHYQQSLLNQIVTSRGAGAYSQDSEIIARKFIAAYAELTGNKRLALEQRNQLFDLQQGPLFMGAAKVEQREVGFSDSVPLATSNIQQCMIVIIHDPDTKLTAMVHFDRATDPASLDAVFERFGNVHLKVRLVGGAGASKSHIASDNMETVVQHLQDRRNVTIESADIGADTQPMAIVYEPETDTLTHAIGIDSHPDCALHKGACAFRAAQEGSVATSDLIPLNVAFDSSGGRSERYPLFLSGESIARLSAQLDQLSARLSELLSEKHQGNLYRGAQAIWNQIYDAAMLDAKGTMEQRSFQVGSLMVLLEENMAQTYGLFSGIAAGARQEGIAIDEAELRSILLRAPKYIGEAGAERNQPITERYLAAMRLGMDPSKLLDVADLGAQLSSLGATFNPSAYSSTGKGSSTGLPDH